ncbi:MAG TPA: helix-turn-helix domain-containing protein [Solirubrobacterales bacterium]|jgi:AcrR family transcriptional regulator|nr:helix-turn-helix domain-containing protein [Solirubrobacterales bacterium]
MPPQQPHPLDSEALEPAWDLPQGRHRLPREVVARNQRLRLVAGVARAMAEHGYARLTVEHVIEAAGVSRTTFYEHFDNKQEAVLLSHDVVFERFLGSLVRACNGEREWPLKVKAAIGTTIAFAVAEPEQAQLLALDALAADVNVTRRVLASNDHLAGLLSAGRQHTPRGADLPGLTEKALVGAVSAIVAGRLMNGEAERLPELEPELVQLVLTPYIGAEEAARVGRGMA